MSADRTQEALTKLEAGIAQLTTSDRWCDYLKAQSRFHRYSFNNTLLIVMQCPKATQVAGFNAWRRLERLVNKGEKAIWILAPLKYHREAEDPETAEVAKLVGFCGFKTAVGSGFAVLEAAIAPLIIRKLSLK